jgi:hypothetical protein
VKIEYYKKKDGMMILDDIVLKPDHAYLFIALVEITRYYIIYQTSLKKEGSAEGVIDKGSERKRKQNDEEGHRKKKEKGALP